MIVCMWRVLKTRKWYEALFWCQSHQPDKQSSWRVFRHCFWWPGSLSEHVHLSQLPVKRKSLKHPFIFWLRSCKVAWFFDTIFFFFVFSFYKIHLWLMMDPLLLCLCTFTIFFYFFFLRVDDGFLTRKFCLSNSHGNQAPHMPFFGPNTSPHRLSSRN